MSEASRLEERLERVITGLRLGDDFGFHVVSCASEEQLEHARRVLATEATDVPLVFTEVAVTELGKGGPRALVERLLHDTARGVLVLGAAVMVEYPERWALVFQRLNEARDRIKGCFDGLVLLLLEPLKPVLAHNAADFWSIRSSSVVLEEGEEIDEDEDADWEPEPELAAGDDGFGGLELDDDESAVAPAEESFALSDREQDVEAARREQEPAAEKEEAGAHRRRGAERPRVAPEPAPSGRRDVARSLPAGAGAPAPRRAPLAPSDERAPPPAAPSVVASAPPSAPARPSTATTVGGGGKVHAPRAKKSKPPPPRRTSLLGSVVDKLRSWTTGPSERKRGLSESAPPLTVLVLSSLHVTDRGKEAGLLEQRLRTLVEDAELARASSSLRPFDLIVIAGDVTARGSTAEMEHAYDELRRLVRRVAADDGPPPLVLVPGNHDVAKDKPDWRKMATKGTDLDEVMGQRHNLGFAKRVGHGYRMLVERLHEDGVVPRAPQMDPYTLLALELSHGGRSVALRGLDSAWSGPWSGKKTGLLGSQQLAYALEGLDEADLRVAVVHHVPAMMDPDEWALLDEAFDLVITGTGHRSDGVVTVTERGTIVLECPGLVGTGRPGHVALELGATLRVHVRWLDGAGESTVHELPWRT